MSSTIDQSGNAIPQDPHFDPNTPDTPGGIVKARLPSLAGQIGPAMSAEVSKALGGFISDAGAWLNVMSKALQPPPEMLGITTMNVMPDPQNQNLMSWPGLAPDQIKTILKQNVGPKMIIGMRVDDVLRYSQYSSHPWKPGWRLETIDGQHEPTKGDLKDIQEAARFLLNCNMETGYTDVRYRDSKGYTDFARYLAAITRDSLTYDEMATWTLPDRSGRIKAFAAISAANVRLANQNGYKGDKRNFAALVNETNQVVKSFTREDLVFYRRNIRTDPEVGDYGWPEIEQAILAIEALQGAIDLNTSTFNKSAIPNGMLLLKGDGYTQKQVDTLAREWTNLKRGVTKAWGLPVFQVPEDSDVEMLDFMNLKDTDMRYRDHMNFMTGVLCVLWRFPVRRLGYKASGMEKDNEPVKGSSSMLVDDDDPGLAPLLTHIESMITEYLVWPRWPHIRFTFTAKNPKEDARQYEAVKLARTWKESRAEADLPPLTSIVPSEYKDFAELMEACPEDASKAGVFQALASTLLKAKLGVEGGTGEKEDGARMTSKVDPAESEKHGHVSGVRRDSAAEKGKA